MIARVVNYIFIYSLLFHYIIHNRFETKSVVFSIQPFHSTTVFPHSSREPAVFCSFSLLFVVALMIIDGRLLVIQPLGHNLAIVRLVCTIAHDSLYFLLVDYVCAINQQNLREL